MNTATIPTQSVASRILTIRGRRIMLDADLADLYGVATKALVQAMKRNRERFPPDFMFQLMEQEVRALRSQFVTLDKASGGSAGAVVDHELLAEELGELGREQPRVDVHAATRGKADHQPHGAGGIGLRGGRSRKEGREKKGTMPSPS